MRINKVDVDKLDPDHAYLIEVDIKDYPVEDKMKILQKIHDEFKKMGINNITMEKGWVEIKDLGPLKDNKNVV